MTDNADAAPAETLSAAQHSEAPHLLTQSEYADKVGKSRQYINKLVKQHRLPMVGEKIDATAADLVLGHAAEPDADEPSTQTQQINDAVARRQAAEADMAVLKLEKARGTLIEKDAAVRAVSEIFGTLRERMADMPVRIADKVLAQKTAREVAAVIREAIDKEFTNHVEVLREQLGDAAAASAAPQPDAGANTDEFTEHPQVAGADSGDDHDGGNPGVDAATPEVVEPVG